MEDYNNELEKDKNPISNEDFYQKILYSQKKLYNCSIFIIILLLALIFIKLFVTG